MSTPPGAGPAVRRVAVGALDGLTDEEARRRLDARGPMGRPPTSRSYASIVRANVLTLFNGILAFFGALTLAFGDWRDALFLGILVANSTIGTVQEIRAKHALDRLAALVAPEATVIRSGRPVQLHAAGLVAGDLVSIQAGDQVVADGVVLAADGLRLDESILTGESMPIARSVGEEVRSGCFAVDGSGAYRVTAVGPDSYAERVTAVARGFRHPRSPLELALNRLLVGLVALMVPLAIALGVSLWIRDVPRADAVPTAVVAIVNLVPEGLILLASLTFAVSAVRMARRGALAQQLNAVESLASVDALCLDKTGTLTEARLRVAEVVPAAGVTEARLTRSVRALVAGAQVRNPTIDALAEAFPGGAPAVSGAVPFSSRWRWSGVRDAEGWVLLGAPELLPLGDLADLAAEQAAAGRRTLGLARSSSPPQTSPGDPRLPNDAEPLGLLVLAEQLRPGAGEAVAYLQAEGIHLIVLSGDAPATVGAIAADVGVGIGPGGVLDGTRLPGEPDDLARAVSVAGAVGRISPDDKRRVVDALRGSGSYVAMLGDGVNDVPALKAARLAIAQASGAQMARSVADIVLVGGDFRSIPPMVEEGRKVLRNLQRVAKLFVAKAAFAAFLVLTVGIAPVDYPFLPRHVTLVSSLTIGIPGFFLALAPSRGSWRPDRFLAEVSRFAAPAGIGIGVGVVGTHLVALTLLDVPLTEARTLAATALLVLGLYLILVLEADTPRRAVVVGGLCAALAAVYAVVIALPVSRRFFALDVPAPPSWLALAAGAATGLALLWASGVRPRLRAAQAGPAGSASPSSSA